MSDAAASGRRARSRNSDDGSRVKIHGRCEVCGTKLVTQQSRWSGRCRGCKADPTRHAKLEGIAKEAATERAPEPKSKPKRPPRPQPPSEAPQPPARKRHRRSKYNRALAEKIRNGLEQGLSVGDAAREAGLPNMVRAYHVMAQVRRNQTRNPDYVAFHAVLKAHLGHRDGPALRVAVRLEPDCPPEARSGFTDEAFLDRLQHELQSARRKFPSSRRMFAALIEEVGEVGRALCEGDQEHLRAELVQVATCALRLAVEGDPEYPLRASEGVLDA